MKLEYVLVLIVVLVILAVVISVVAPAVQVEIAQALAPLQNIAEVAPVQ